MPSTTIPGEYTFNFRGFERDTRATARSRFLVGVGWIRLVESGAGGRTVQGEHYSINMPMSGGGSHGTRHPATYTLSGSWTPRAIRTGGALNPLGADLNITFTEVGGNGLKMSDTFVVLQSGPDRFWLVSADPKDQGGALLDEVVLGEAVKITAAW